MSLRVVSRIALIAAVAVLLLGTGCTSRAGIGDVWYGNGSISLAVTNPQEPAEAYIQVTVYRIENLRQEEETVVGKNVNLTQGANTVSIPGKLGNGQYKLYVYMTQNGERKTAVIRDITVRGDDPGQ